MSSQGAEPAPAQPASEPAKAELAQEPAEAELAQEPAEANLSEAEPAEASLSEAGLAEAGLAEVELAEAELAAERAVVARIASVRAVQLAQVAGRAERLAAEAGEMTEDGLRDVYDEDDDPDAWVQAALVRERAVHAVAAARRFDEVDSIGNDAAFGRITDDDGESLYVGKCSVIDGEDALLVDWRARAAIPFYRATPLSPMGVAHRRHLHYSPPPEPELTSYSDEVFDTEYLGEASGLQGEAALLAALGRETTGQMGSVVATIQAEQDAVIRSPADRALLVQGGPGTGKTVVALHRAAYLLYDQRQALAENGVLIVGPSSHFLAYISQVLPSLGETGVVSATPSQLYTGVRRGGPGPGDVAGVKGRAEMAALLAKAVKDRQIRPRKDLAAWYGSDRVVVPRSRLEECFERAQRNQAHNEGAERFRVEVIEAFAEVVYNRSFDNYADAYRSFARSASLRIFLLRHWPTLSPEQALNDLLGSPALLRLAAVGSGLTRAQVRLLGRDRVPEAELAYLAWSDADIPLLDELRFLVGGLGVIADEDDRQRERDARDEFEIAAAKDRLDNARADDRTLTWDEATDAGDDARPPTPARVLPPPPIRGDRV